VKACVVIPTLNACDMLMEALVSLEAQTVRAEVVVVDNASTDGTREMLATRFPWVKVITNDRNLGFGKAVNRGVAGAPAGTDVIVLVNNDVVCEPDFVERMLAPFSDERIKVVGVLVQGSARPRRLGRHRADSASGRGTCCGTAR
jgi:GT2 family glycosyltransferase